MNESQQRLEQRLERMELLIVAIIDCLREKEAWVYYTTTTEQELADRLEKEYR